MEQFIQVKVWIGLMAIFPLLCTTCKRDAQKEQQLLGAASTMPLQWQSKDWYASTCALDSLQCMRIKVRFPLVADSSPVAKRINDTIRANLQTLLAGTLSAANESISMNFEQWAQYLLGEYEELVDDDPAYRIPWEVKLVADSLYQNPFLLSLKMEFLAFTGGAHPNVRQVLINFDLRNGQKIELQTILSNEDGLKQLLKDQNLASQDDFPEQRGLDLPENFAIMSEGLYFLYNPLEVVAYGLTLKEFTLSYDEIEGVLNEEGKILFNYN